MVQCRTCRLENKHYTALQRNKAVMEDVGLKLSAVFLQRTAARCCLWRDPSGHVCNGNKLPFAVCVLSELQSSSMGQKNMCRVKQIPAPLSEGVKHQAELQWLHRSLPGRASFQRKWKALGGSGTPGCSCTELQELPCPLKWPSTSWPLPHHPPWPQLWLQGRKSTPSTFLSPGSYIYVASWQDAESGFCRADVLKLSTEDRNIKTYKKKDGVA